MQKTTWGTVPLAEGAAREEFSRWEVSVAGAEQQMKGSVSLMRSHWRRGPMEPLKLAGRNLGFYPKCARKSLQGLNM